MNVRQMHTCADQEYFVGTDVDPTDAESVKMVTRKGLTDIVEVCRNSFHVVKGSWA